jgi:hypothetical protein
MLCRLVQFMVNLQLVRRVSPLPAQLQQGHLYRLRGCLGINCFQSFDIKGIEGYHGIFSEVFGKHVKNPILNTMVC